VRTTSCRSPILRASREGDVLMVTRINRIGMSPFDPGHKFIVFDFADHVPFGRQSRSHGQHNLVLKIQS
jgi:hypothetical protein